MAKVNVTRDEFLENPLGRTFADVVNDKEQTFDTVLDFFNDENRQRRMEESELHHDRSPLAGVVRELESLPAIDQFLSAVHAQRSTRLRQAIGVIVRMIMERRGWQKTGKKGSLGVRAARADEMPAHNNGGLAFWFVRSKDTYDPRVCRSSRWENGAKDLSPLRRNNRRKESDVTVPKAMKIYLTKEGRTCPTQRVII